MVIYSEISLFCLHLIDSLAEHTIPRNFLSLFIFALLSRNLSILLILVMIFFFFKRSVQSSHCGSAEMNLTSLHKDVGSIPGLAQWIGDLALPWAVVEVKDVAPVLSCCGCVVGQRLQL